MKKLFLSIFLCGCSVVFGQDLSLQEALLQAKSYKKEQGVLELQIQEIQQKINRRKQLPLLTGEANLQRNLIIPVTPVPSIAFDPNAQPGEITPLKFATDWSAKAGLQLSLDLFNSQNQLNIKQAENQNRKAEIDKQQSAEDFKKLIIDLYAQAYLAQQQFEVSVLNENNFKETLQIIIKRNEAGRVSDLEKNAALQKAYELQLTVDESELVLQNKYLQLANYFDVTAFDFISTSIDDIIQQNLTIADYEIEQLKLDIDAKEIEIQNNKLTSIPKLTFNAFYGGQFYDNQLKITNSDNWFGNSYVNLALRIPITENIEKRLKAKQFDFDKEIIQSKLETLEREKLNSDKQKQNDLLILSQKIQAYKQIVSLAESNVKIVKAQVDAGTVLISEYNKELENLFTQNQKLWQTSYDLLKKRLE